MKRRKRVLLLPGPTNHLLTGNLKLIPKPGPKFLEFFRRLPEKYPYLCRLNLGPHKNTVFVYHPKFVKQILKTSEPKITSFGGSYSLLKPWLGEGLVISGGSKWFRNRKLLTPAFHFEVLKPYMEIYNRCADTLIDAWMSKTNGNPVVELFGALSLCTLNIVLKCGFSYDEDVQLAGSSHPYIKAVLELAQIQQKRNLTLSYQILSIFRFTKVGKRYLELCDYVHDVADNIIAKRKKTLSQEQSSTSSSQRRSRDFLDILLLAKDDNGVGLTDREIRQEVDTFLFGGHDTTASALTWLFYALAGHKECQRKIQEEIDAIGEKDVKWDDLNSIPYTTMCIKESMRLYSPAPFIGRELTKPMVFQGVEVLPGTTVTIALYCLHHNPIVWGEDHMEYKPERFSADNIAKMDSHAFCPFSAGPRNCIGQSFAMNEVKTIAVKILRKFNLELADNVEEPILIPQIIMRSMNGVHVKIIPRS